MAGGPMDLWNQWATQILVLLSLTLQVVLHIFAGVRRREAMAVERLLLWLSYQLADSTAIYAVGHLSFSSAPREHKLVAFWAPFLLLHLGGPDNITAYALEDNKLWKRHLVTLVVQVLAAEYVLYKNIASNGMPIMVAAIVMFIVGTAKYGERTWALWCANFNSIRNSLKVVPRDKHQHFYIKYEHRHHLGYVDGTVSGEFLLQRAHSLFHICKRGIVDSVIDEDDDPINPDLRAIWNLVPEDKDHKRISTVPKEEGRKRMWTVMEMELSLMYDILYTKAYVIHTFFGYGIRIVTPPAIVASLLLFHFSGKGGHRGVDVSITYVLLGGALVLETKSLLSALGSTWALVFLCGTRWSWLRHAVLCSGRWHRFRRAMLSLRRATKIVTLGRSRRWSSSMGQFNMLQSCTRVVTGATTTRSWFDDLSTRVGFTDWLDLKHCSRNIPVPEKVMTSLQEMHKFFKPGDLNIMGLLRHNWGDLAMGKVRGSETRPEQFKKLKNYHGVDFHESILIWHIATDLFLTKTGRDGSRVKAIKALSNYMMFLFVHHPDMLPGLPQNWLYQKTKENIVESCKTPSGGKSSVLTETKQLASILLELKIEEEGKPDPKVPRLRHARNIADTFSNWEGEDPVNVLLDLWIDFLMYAANRCNRESHAKKLNTGCEFLTIVWLMIEHFQQLAKAHKEHTAMNSVG